MHFIKTLEIMKKLGVIVIVFLGLSSLSKAQSTKTFFQAGMAVSNNTTYESVEAGATTGKNRLSFLVESYNKGNDATFNADREYFGGIKYTRGVAVGKKLDLLMSCAAKIHIDKAKTLSLEPGIGLGLNLSKSFSIVGSMTSPIVQNTTPFKQLQLKAGVGVQVRI